MEKHSSTIHRFLLSTTSRFIGEYKSPDIEISLAWLDTFNRNQQLQMGMQENPYSRNYLVLSIEIENPTKKENELESLPNYTYFGDNFCTTLAILYGKRFDNHGFLISHGMFSVPVLSGHQPTAYFKAGPNSHTPRKDLEIPLNLEEVRRIAPIFIEEKVDRRFLDILFAAGRFYGRSLRMFDSDPASAYLDLITCGEILSNYYKFSEEDLYDDDVRELFGKMQTEMQQGDDAVKKFKGSMRQIKRKYTLTLTGLLTGYFYGNAESKMGNLCKEDIDVRLKAAYDLRSLYVHTGIEFGHWIRPYAHILNEIQLGEPVVGDKAFRKAITKAPTFFGLERVMRYCLLRCIHLHGVQIDPQLDGPAPDARPSPIDSSL